MRNAEDVLIVAEFPVTRDINELAFELFVRIGEVAYKLFVGGGCEVMVASASARYESITIFNILKAEL